MQKINYETQAGTLIPPTWRLRAQSLGKILFFGRVTIQAMIQDWLHAVEDIAREIWLLDQKNQTPLVEDTKREKPTLSPRDQRQQLTEEIEEINQRIRRLLVLQRQAKEKPAMPDHRPKDWFHQGDTVICYIGNRDHRIIKDDFVIALIKETQPFITVDYQQQVYETKYAHSSRDTVGYRRPEIMRPAELSYLIDHPDFAKIWAEDGVRPDRTKEFNAGQFLTALNLYAKTPSAT